MKIFISWSGDNSNSIAQTLRHWLPNVLQAVKPYFSPDDITKGSRWSHDIATQLKESKIGILCLTTENILAPWLLFEAGAISNTLDEARVIPLLVGIEASELPGPLTQFQSVTTERDDIFKLLSLINRELGSESLREAVLASVFDKWWPDLESRLRTAINRSKRLRIQTTEQTDRDLLKEILSLQRVAAFRMKRSPLTDSDSEYLDLPITSLPLSSATTSALSSWNIYTLGQLMSYTSKDMKRMSNFGPTKQREVEKLLEFLNLSLHIKSADEALYLDADHPPSKRREA